jgi:hypothetical protein
VKRTAIKIVVAKPQAHDYCLRGVAGDSVLALAVAGLLAFKRSTVMCAELFLICPFLQILERSWKRLESER